MLGLRKAEGWLARRVVLGIGALCALVLAVTACTPVQAPDGSENHSSGFSLAESARAAAEGQGYRARSGHFRSSDGLELAVRAWLPHEEEPRAVILALHGFNDYAHAFAPLGEALAQQGIAVFAYDQRGFGESPNTGLWAGGEVMTADVRTAAARLRGAFPGVPLYLFGESMGGAVLLAAETEPEGLDADGLILSAPAVWARETQPWYQRVGLWVALRTVPWFRPPASSVRRQASDNIEMLRALRRDPLVLGSARIDTIAGLVDLMDRALAAGPDVRTPTLLLYGERDEIIPDEPMERLWQEMPQEAGHRFLRYPDGWHLLTRDLQGPRVIDDIAAWIDNPTGTLPSTVETLPEEHAQEAGQREG